MKKTGFLDLSRGKDKDKNRSGEAHFETLRLKVKEESSRTQTTLDSKWSEIKIFGKNICRRSYHSATVNEDRIYIYGGYEVNEGILSDFYEMLIKHNQVFQWKKLEPNKDKIMTPGTLMRHSAVSFQDRMYIFGGNYQSLCSSNTLWAYDYNQCEWERVSPKGNLIPPNIDSHSAAVDDFNHCMYIFGGFSNSKDGGYQNKVWKFDFESREWQILGANSKNQPCRRAGSSITLCESTIYMFGGTIVDVKFNDLWAFDLKSEEWQEFQMGQGDVIPETRNGHTLINYRGKLILFGGIHDITHEKNDMYVFETQAKKWKIVDSNTSHNQSALNDDVLPVDQNIHGEFHPLARDALSPLKKTMSEKNTQFLFKNLSPNSRNLTGPPVSRTLRVPILSQLNETIVSKEETAMANNQLEENKKKRLQMKKMNLLSEFELKDDEKIAVRPISPTTETMKNSIVTVGNPMGKAKYALKILEDSYSRIQSNSPDQMQNKMIGRRPCARDGHSAVISDNQCFIFGGDRHMMSYNDLYAVDLDKIVETLP